MANNTLASIQIDLPYQCTLCRDKFPSLAALEAHLRVHLCIRPYKCSLCRQEFSVPTELENHVKDHSSSMLFKCDLCTCSYNRSCDLKSHKESSHRSHLISSQFEHQDNTQSISIPFKCDLCATSFNRSCDLNAHTETSHRSRVVSSENHNNSQSSSKTFDCDLCTSTFSRLYDLTTHIKKGHRSDKPHRCSVCKKNFRTSNDLEFHMLCHGEKPFRCPHCDWLTNHDYGSLRHHVKNRHQGERRFNCQSCEKKFLGRSSLRQHLLNQHGNLMCRTCDMVFENDHLLDIHLQEHNKEKSKHCPHCNKSYSSEQNLSRHMQIHDQRYVCTYSRQCHCTFVSLEEYNKHLTKHAEEAKKLACHQNITCNSVSSTTAEEQNKNKIPCSICGKKFRRPNLKIHMSSHDPKPYGCCQCGSRFRFMKSLQNHTERHQAQGMLKCTLCDEEFPVVSDVKNHISSSHAGSYKCKQCLEIFWTSKDLSLHIKCHTSAKEICLVCSKSCNSKKKLREHVLHFHNRRARLQCPSCPHRFTDLTRLTHHIRMQHDCVHRYVCDVCLKLFPTKRSLQHHMRVCHQDNRLVDGSTDSQSLDKDNPVELVDEEHS